MNSSPTMHAAKAQKDIFSEGEANAWLARNRRSLQGFDETHDPLFRHLLPHLRPGIRIAEVGCSLAHRLAALARSAKGTGLGIDPSEQAISEGRHAHPQLELIQGTADALPWPSNSIDVLVYGFCLYLCDRADLFAIAAEGDRVLKEGGVLAILDFAPPFPYRNPYAHRPGVFTYKMDYARLWLWNPAYVETSREVFDHQLARDPAASHLAPDERVSVSILRKQCAYAYPSHPDYGS